LPQCLKSFHLNNTSFPFREILNSACNNEIKKNVRIASDKITVGSMVPVFYSGQYGAGILQWAVWCRYSIVGSMVPVFYSGQYGAGILQWAVWCRYSIVGSMVPVFYSGQYGAGIL